MSQYWSAKSGRSLMVSAALALVLAACGGGGGGGGSTTASGGQVASPPAPPAPPPPSPPPPPPPAGTATPVPFALTRSQTFATVGWATRPQSQYPIVSEAPAPTTEQLLELSWSAALQTYEVRLPDLTRATLRRTYPGTANTSAFDIIDSAGQAVPGFVTVAPQPQLLNSGTGGWSAPGAPRYTGGVFAFGIPTEPGDVPPGGTATFNAVGLFGQEAVLSFDFGTCALTGFIDVAWTDAWGPYPNTRYTLTPAAYAPGSTTFTARFTVPGAPAEGIVEGRFSGPRASEVLVRWQAPIRDQYGGQWVTIYGVWVGRR